MLLIETLLLAQMLAAAPWFAGLWVIFAAILLWVGGCNGENGSVPQVPNLPTGVPQTPQPPGAPEVPGHPGVPGGPLDQNQQACPAGQTTCTITSETVATSPTGRARTRIGVGEEVKLTVSPGPATWAKSSGGGTLSPSSGSHTSVTYTAGDTAGKVTITASPSSGCSCTIELTVVAPSGWSMKQTASTNIKHTHGRPDCGWKGSPYVNPNDVNFYNIDVRELDSRSVASNSYHPSLHNKWHGNYPPPDRASPWIPIIGHADADGSELGGVDEVYSGYPNSGATGSAPPFNVGDYYWPITMQWRVGTGTIHNFPVVRQQHEIFSDGKCESRKGGNTEHAMWNWPTSTY